MDTTRRVILICGLPGSGKTTYANNITSQINNVVLIDDPVSWDAVLTQLSHSGSVVLTDPYLCIEKNRQEALCRFEELGFVVEWVFFENNPKQCIVNSFSRKDKEVRNDIMWFSKQYTIPPGVIPLKVYSQS